MKNNLYRVKNIAPLDKKEKKKEEDKFETIHHKLNEKKENEPNLSHATPPNMNTQFSQVLNMFQTLMKTMSKSAEVSQPPLELEVRDRHVVISLPDLDEAIDKAEKILLLEKWIEKVCENVVSVSFNYHSNDQLTYEQAKAFCSQNILKNVIRLNQKYHLNAEEMRKIDMYIQEESINYLLKKYPLTEAFEVNKALEKVAKSFDARGLLGYHLFQGSNIHFTWRETGNYNDLIKKSINKIIEKTNASSNIKKERTNFQFFSNLMSSVFQKVQDRDWMTEENQQKKTQFESPKEFCKPVEKKPSTILKMFDKQFIPQKLADVKERMGINFEEMAKQKQEKQKYKQMVQEYTNYLIGRKISENVPSYTDQQIESTSFSITNPAILRILTKWCEQLWEKFRPKNYFANKNQDFLLNNGEKVTLSPEMKSDLDKKMNLQKKQIQIFMEKILRDSYNIQISSLEILHSDNDSNFADSSLIKTCGKFAVLIGKSLEKYVVKYLNRLIHGLLKVSKSFFDEQQVQTLISPLNLISFSLGDLMRCKCSSKENQILKIFQELQRMSQSNPEVLRIVRIKNRLRQGTNDILINAIFSDTLLCEIQLAVNSKKSKFIKCSNNFCHYLYELQRSAFGPLNELCSIWRNLDGRSVLYDKIVEKEQGDLRSGNHSCQTKKIIFQFEPFEQPFICSVCSSTYSDQIYIKNHLKCSECSYWKCAKCQIKLNKASDLAEQFVEDENVRKHCLQIYNKIYENQQFPSFGVCIKIESKRAKPTLFQKIQLRGITYLLGEEDKKITSILKIIDEKAEKKFATDHLIFEIDEGVSKELILISEERAINEYLLPLTVKDYYKGGQENIILEHEGMVDESLMDIFDGQKQKRLKVTELNIAKNQITRIGNLSKLLPNIVHLDLHNNQKLVDLEGIEGFQKLYKVNLQGLSQITIFPESLFKCRNLRELYLNHSRIKVLPNQIKSFINLKVFSICGQVENLGQTGLIYDIPQGFYELINLEVANLSRNRIKEISENIGKLQNLKCLKIDGNLIRILPEALGKLKYLQQITFEYNNLDAMPSSIKNWKLKDKFELKNIGTGMMIRGQKIYQCYLKKLPSDLEEISNLTVIDIHSVALQSLPSLKKAKNLIKLDVKRCTFDTLPDLSSCKKLEVLNASCQLNSAKLTALPTSLSSLTNLKLLDVCINIITKIPDEIGFCCKLQELYLNNNKINSISAKIGNLTSLKKLNLYDNLLEEFPDEFGKLESLEYLYLSKNMFVRFPQAVTKCCQLKQLYLYQNKLENISRNIKFLKELTTLCLYENKITIIVAELQELTNLQPALFQFHQNPVLIVEAPEEILKQCEGNSRSLIYEAATDKINLKCQNLKTLPKEISLRAETKQIDLTSNQLQTLPQEFSKLRKLEKITANSNKFPSIPEPLTSCLNINHLNFHDNQVKTIPDSIGNLSLLKYLNLSNNLISIMPPSLNKCINLEELYLSENKFIQFSVDLKDLQKLKYFMINQNQLQTFPSGLLQCQALEEIYACENQITQINCDFSNLIKLNVLELKKNKLTAFSNSLCSCKSLSSLSLHQNSIESINENIFQMESLVYLLMPNNKIKILPDALFLCEQLKTINLEENLIEVIPASFSKLTNLIAGYTKFWKNPLNKVECMQFLIQKGNQQTKDQLRKILN